MANTPAPARKRIGDYVSDLETGEVLDGIANTDVEIQNIEFDRRNGKNGRYTLSVFTLTDGRKFHTGSATVADRVAGLFGMTGDQLATELDAGAPSPSTPDDVFPVTAKFTRVQSQNNRGQSYWTVE